MKNTQQTVLRAAIIAALGFAGQNAAAVTGADLTGGTAISAIKIAKELPATSTLTSAVDGNFLAYIAVPAGYVVDATNKYLNVKVNLLGGAKFGAVPTLRCATAGAVNSVSGVISIGGNGVSNVTFVVEAAPGGLPSANSTVTTAICVMTANSISASGTTDKTISATIEYKDGANNIASGAANTYISFVKGLSANISAGDKLIIDVAASSNKLSGAATTGYVGAVKYANISSTTLTAGLAGGIDAATIVSTTPATVYSVTIAGPSLPAASSVFLSTTPTDCSNNSYSAAPTGSASTSLTITGVTPTHISAGLGVCLAFNGSTPIPEGQITATISRNMETSAPFQPDFSPLAGNLAILKKNGATVNVDFLTNPTGFPTFVRFTNPTSLSGNVLVDAYNDDGAKGTSTWTFVLGAGKSVMYPMDVIMTKTGIAASTVAATDGALAGNKFRLIVNAEFPTLGVQALNLSKDGNAFGQLTGSRN